MRKYNEIVAASHELMATKAVKRQQQFDMEMATLREERRLDCEACVEDFRLARVEREEVRKQDREHRKDERREEREDRNEFFLEK